MRKLISRSVISFFAVAVARTNGMVININPVAGGGLDSSNANYNASALSTFQAAANDLSARFSDNITINVTADLTSSGFASPNIIGQTQSSLYLASYSSVRTQLNADAVANPSNNTVAIEAAMPMTMPTFTQPASGTTTSGYNYSFSTNSSIAFTSANGRALGYSLPATSDGTITFNSNFAFSYTGAQPSKIDFRTTAEHELIHLLGFTSTTDTNDVNLHTAKTDGLTAGTIFTVTPRVLDLYRFSSSNTPLTLANLTTNPRDLVPGSNDFTSDSTVAYRMSTGAYNGDGNQASHWKADEITGVTIGIMDPTESYNQATPVSSADIRALELLGYDFVPEPTGAMLAFGLAFGRLARRRRTA